MTENRPWRIGINAHLLAGQDNYRRAGIHHYIAKTLQHLPGDGLLGSLIIYVRHGAELGNDSSRRVARSRWPTERRLVRIAWEQAAWPWLLRRDGVDLVHSTAFVLPAAVRLPAIVTVYDLSFMHYPQSFPPTQRRYLQMQTKNACARARRIVTISDSSRRDLQQIFGVSRERIAVIRPGVGDQFYPLPAEKVAAFRHRNGLPERFILHVGTLQPRKNILLLLEALSLLPSRDRCLVLAGGKGWYYEAIERRVGELGLKDKVYFVGYVPDQELPYYYNAASAVAVPSLYEGFGLPVVEALACATPVVAAQSSSLPEAGADLAHYFEAASASSLAVQLAAVLDDGALKQQLRLEGPLHASRFSWSEAGRRTAALYNQVLTEI